MAKEKKPMRTDIGWSDASSITLFGKDFPSEILGTLNLGDMWFLELTGRVPNPAESRMFNAMVVCLVEHGITPSALVSSRNPMSPRLSVPRISDGKSLPNRVMLEASLQPMSVRMGFFSFAI